MLLNKWNQDVTSLVDRQSKHASPKMREKILSHVTEVKIPSGNYPKGMFSIEARAVMR